MSIRKNSNTLIFKSTEKHGFIPSQIIYVEGKFNVMTNYFIIRNFKKISDKFKKSGFDFIYIPGFIDDLINSPLEKVSDIVNFCAPYLSSESFFEQSNNFCKKLFNENFEDLSLYNNIYHLFFASGYKREISPGFLRLVNDSETDDFTFEYFKFDLANKNNFWMQIKKYLKKIPAKSKTSHLSLTEKFWHFFDDFFAKKQAETKAKEKAIDIFEEKKSSF